MFLIFLVMSVELHGQEKEYKLKLFHIDAGRHTMHKNEPWGFVMNVEYGKERATRFFLTTALGFGA